MGVFEICIKYVPTSYKLVSLATINDAIQQNLSAISTELPQAICLTFCVARFLNNNLHGQFLVEIYFEYYCLEAVMDIIMKN